MSTPATTSAATASAGPTVGPGSGRIAGVFRFRPGEGVALALSFAYFFLLLAGYYTIRPLRDSLAAGLGSDQIKYLSTSVFFVMLAIAPVFGWLVARIRRRVLVPSIYAFFALQLFGLSLLLDARPHDPNVARGFYVWVTVFNYFVVAVFWSFMADVWREEQGRRLFGVIAAGGSLGGLTGPWLTGTLVERVGNDGIALLACGFLTATLVAIVALEWHVQRAAAGAGGGLRSDEPVGGAILAGLTRLARTPFLLGIAAIVGIGSLLGMFVYIEMARLVAEAFPTPEARTQFFAERDTWINGLAVLLQFFVVGRLTSWLGVRTALTAVAVLAVASFVAVALMPMLTTLVVVSILQRALEFGVGKPARDMVYTVVDVETKYKVKNVIDTAVARGSETVSGWTHGALAAAGLGLSGIAGVACAIAVGLVAIAWSVGTGYRRRGGL
jgi:AAA family ATP:ADP antiporter